MQIQAHIPESYIDSLSQRLDIYRRIADIRDRGGRYGRDRTS